MSLFLNAFLLTFLMLTTTLVALKQGYNKEGNLKHCNPRYNSVINGRTLSLSCNGTKKTILIGTCVGFNDNFYAETGLDKKCLVCTADSVSVVCTCNKVKLNFVIETYFKFDYPNDKIVCA